jgi:hypothetical protein
MVVLKRVRLGPQHHPSLTKHTISDISGTREFPPFVEYLFHVCADGQAADTWHESVEEAVDQAEWEFGVQPDEWAAPDHPETF